MDDEVLPYRAGAAELVRWVEGRARGRTAAQLRDAGLSPKVLEGVSATATALGLADGQGELSPFGRRFALAAAAERSELLRDALLRFPPYREVLRAISARGGERTTEVQWIETWWATHGHGNSQSNRREGAATFGRLAEWTGLGRYIPGRRGHATRIEWTPGALALASGGGAAPAVPAAAVAPAAPVAPAAAVDPTPRSAPALHDRPETPRPATAPSPPPPVEPESGVGPRADVNRVSLPIRGGQIVRLEVPVRMPRSEKKRLLELLELLILED